MFAGNQQHVVAAVDESFRLGAVLVPLVEPSLKRFAHAVVTAVDMGIGPLRVFVPLDLGIKAHKDQSEIPAIHCRISALYKTGEHQPPKPRSRWQPHPGVSEASVGGGKTDEQALIQAAALTRFFTQRTKRDADAAPHLHVLLRHRPRSIPQLQESA
jgi:hypothetical protein